MVKAEQLTSTRVIGIKLELSMLEATTILKEMAPSVPTLHSKHYHEARKVRIRKALLDAGVPLPAGVRGKPVRPCPMIRPSWARYSRLQP